MKLLIQLRRSNPQTISVTIAPNKAVKAWVNWLLYSSYGCLINRFSFSFPSIIIIIKMQTYSQLKNTLDGAGLSDSER